MIASPFAVPPLPDDEIHVWRLAWPGAPGDPSFDGLLGAYAGPTAPAWDRGEHGKPRLPAPWDAIGFNWSHSGDAALFAVGRGHAGFEVGVDVERVRPRPRALELADRFFSPGEAEWMRDQRDDRQLDGFLALWTAKEAVLKAHGGGLSSGLHRAAFAFVDGELRPVAFDGEIGPAEAWRVSSLDLGPGFAGAVAWRGGDRRVRVFTSVDVFTSAL